MGVVGAARAITSPSECPGIIPTVEQPVLAGDIAGVDRAKKGAGRAELRGLAEAPGGNLGSEATGGQVAAPIVRSVIEAYLR